MRLLHRALAGLVVVSAAGLSTAAMAGEEPSLVYEPATEWMLEYGDARCRAGRIFGSEEKPTLLLLDQHNPGSNFSWLIAGEALEDVGSNKRLLIRFGENNEEFLLDAGLILKMDGYGKAFRGTGVRKAQRSEQSAEPDFLASSFDLDPAEGAAIKWIDVSRGGKIVRLQTGSLEHIYRGLNKCMEDLVRHWGVDPAIQRTVVTAPKFQNGNEVARRIQRDYPSRALFHNEQTDLHIRVMIDANAKVTSCTLTNLTAAKSFTEKACSIIEKHAEFTPAVDQSGNSVPSYFVGILSYRIG